MRAGTSSETETGKQTEGRPQHRVAEHWSSLKPELLRV